MATHARYCSFPPSTAGGPTPVTGGYGSSKNFRIARRRYTYRHKLPADASKGRLSRSYAISLSAVEAHLHKACVGGTGIILSEHAASSIPLLNVIPCGPATKKGKIGGQLTSNASSNDARRGTYLNNPEVALKVERPWGKINHPTVTDIARVLLDEEATQGSRDNIVMWISDHKGAFTLPKFNPEHVHLMTSRLRSGHIFVHLYGNFGRTGLPFAFEVVTRVLRALIVFVIFGVVLMYCADLIGVGSRSQ